MVTLTFMRHAESEYNKMGCFTGQLDCNATIEGLKEAKHMYQNFSSLYYIVYCSPLKRTQQTCTAILPNITPIIDERIIECSLGIWEGCQKTEVHSDLLSLYRKGEYVPPKAESFEEVDARVYDFMKEIFEKYQHNENILVITHNGVMKSIKRNVRLPFESVMSKNLETITITERDLLYYIEKEEIFC